MARMRGQPVELLYEHVAAPRAPHTPALELEVEPPVGGTDVADADRALVVAATPPMAAAFFSGSKDHDAGKAVAEDAPEASRGDEAWEREQGT